MAFSRPLQNRINYKI